MLQQMGSQLGSQMASAQNLLLRNQRPSGFNPNPVKTNQRPPSINKQSNAQFSHLPNNTRYSPGMASVIQQNNTGTSSIRIRPNLIANEVITLPDDDLDVPQTKAPSSSATASTVASNVGWHTPVQSSNSKKPNNDNES